MSSLRPSRLQVAYIYYKRILRWRRNSSPYISGDAFADLAEFVYRPPKWRDMNKKRSLSEAEIIFCESHRLQELLDKYSGQLKVKVIITGNSDYEFHEVPTNIPESVRALFLQNSFISDNKRIFTIPIGLENFRLGVNGNPKYITFENDFGFKPNRVLFGPLSATHPVRAEVISKFDVPSRIWEMLSVRQTPRQYNQTCQRFKYVAAVRGNGVDTHRLWEALYRGLIPIVSQDSWWESIQQLYPPVISISNWERSNIEAVVDGDSPEPFNPESVEALWMPYWEKKIKTFLG